MFSSCVPRSLELSLSIDPFEQSHYRKIVHFGQSSASVRAAFSTQTKPLLVVRLLEYIQFKGSYCEPCTTGRLVSVPVVSNLQTAAHIFDSSIGFQPHRVRLRASVAPEQVTFADLALDFANLTSKFAAPTQEHCAAADSAGACLRCGLGYFFSSDGSSCTKCEGFYVASLDTCLPDTAVDASAGHKVFAGQLEVQMFDHLSPQMADVQFASFFGSSPADSASMLSESLPTDDSLEYLFRIRLALSTADNFEDISVPSYNFLQFSGFSGLLGQLADAVSKPNPKTLLYELFLDYSASADPPSSNYVLPLPNASAFSSHGLGYDLSVSYITYDHESLVRQHFGSEPRLVPVQMRSTTVSVSRLGPFWSVSKSTSAPENGFQLFYTNSPAIRLKVACFEGCDHCSVDRLCNACAPGFYLDGKSCERCSADCATCQDHPNNCLTSADPPIDETQRTPSPEQLLDAPIVGSSLRCNSLCETCEQGVCLRCVAGSGSNGRECVSCSQSQYFDARLEICLDCPPDCDTCPGGECSACKPGFVLEPVTRVCMEQAICANGIGKADGRITCRTCPDNCQVCAEDLTCISCARGHFLRDSLCHSCIDNCIFCFHERHCLQCIQDFWFDRSLSRCIGLTAVQDQTRNPFQYIGLIRLSWASTVVFLSQSILFQRRDPNCVSFGLTGICVQCRARYFLGFDNECHPCQGLCLICSGIDRCTLCKSHAKTEYLGNGFVSCTLEVSCAASRNSRRTNPSNRATRCPVRTAKRSAARTVSFASTTGRKSVLSARSATGPSSTLSWRWPDAAKSLLTSASHWLPKSWSSPSRFISPNRCRTVSPSRTR